jgi:hypothetical protein
MHKIAKGFDFCGFRLSYNKIILAKSCLAKFEKRLSKLYEQLSKCKSSSYKNEFITIALLKNIELYVWQFGQWAKVVRQRVIKTVILTICRLGRFKIPLTLGATLVYHLQATIDGASCLPPNQNKSSSVATRIDLLHS